MVACLKPARCAVMSSALLSLPVQPVSSCPGPSQLRFCSSTHRSSPPPSQETTRFPFWAAATYLCVIFLRPESIRSLGSQPLGALRVRPWTQTGVVSNF